MLALLIDGLNMIRRIHAALPQEHEPQAALEGLLRSVQGSIRRALATHRPSHVCCVIDGQGRTWRHDIYPDYKKNRSPMPADLSVGLPRLVEEIEGLGINCVSIPRLEADDVIASMANTFAAAGAEVIILSTDTSFCQLLGAGVRIHDHFANMARDTHFVHDRFGVAPEFLPTLLALAGLPSVNIHGVKGIGTKTAAALVNQFGPLAAILRSSSDISGRPGTLLRAQTEAAELAFKLVTLKMDVRVGRNLKQLRRPDALA